MSVETTQPEGNKAGGTETPKLMRAAAIDRFGGPEELRIRELPAPEVGEGEVLIALDTAGVGSWDAEMRAGWYPDGLPRFPLVLGTDGSGKVAAMGSHVRRFQIGDPVYAYSFANPKGGFYAGYVAVAAEKAAPIPKGLSMREAGAIATTGLTALQGIDDVLEIKRGESIAIVGASGGVGTLALQFAKLRGARVLGVASGADGVELVRKLGADAAVDGRNAELGHALQNFAPDGIDAVLALSGGDTLDRVVQSVKSGGRVAYPNGVEPEPKKRPGTRVASYDAAPGVREFSNLRMAIEAMNLIVPIAATFPLANAADAHRRLEQGHVLGKIVLDIA
jgi:NADPH:quinone reductase-like Zn-dependent oxidoreductase